jgi:hypothetical protein
VLCAQEAPVTSHCGPSPPNQPWAVFGLPRVSNCSYDHLPELSCDALGF